MSLASHLTRSAVAVAAAGALAVGTTGTSTALSQPSSTQPSSDSTLVEAGAASARQHPTLATASGVYIVTLAGKPSAVYDGGVAGLAATRPTDGERFDRTRPGVEDYEQRLHDRQDEILERIGDPKVLYRFATAVNGFVAELTTEQVKQLRGSAGVTLVERSTTQQVDTVDSPATLGLPEVWQANGGPDRAGKGTVVGVIDSGIWPENPSFAGVPLRSPGRSDQVPGFHGACQEGDQWDVNDCNDKLVSARYFVDGFGEENLSQSEYLSPRDGSGHGSHTASTAAGNHDVAVDIDGQDFGFASGMAPAARIAAYKICWTAPNPDDDGCTTADAVAAIDQAVADGVDVINYSVSGAEDSFPDSVELAFLNASAAGVFVATSAGNGGPRAGSVRHASPWVTTVGANTHRLFRGTVELGDDDGTRHVGAMVSDEDVPETDLVLGADVAADSAGPEAARICEIGALDAEEVQDKIVVCERGTTARVDKSAAVARAGGAGMILVNVRPDTVDADVHSVPTVHVDTAAGDAVKTYLREAGSDATASISASGADEPAGPSSAESSARGPAADAGVLKPDLTAPGVSVVGAVSPPANSGRLWDLYSGTSMSAAHVAGLAAFVAGERPEWTPAEVKSAMMTTADALDSAARPFAQGAGQVDPRDLLDPGLVLSAGTQDYLDYLAGQGFTRTDGTPVSANAIDAHALNLPSIAVGDLTGNVSVTRRVTNLSSSPQTFTAEVTGLSGIDATLDSSEITVGAHKSARVTVTFSANEQASLGNFTKGALTLRSVDSTVRIPIVVRPQMVSVPAEVTAEAGDGSVTVQGRTGTDAEVALTTAGLASATPAGVTLVPGPFDAAAPASDEDTFEVDVPISDYTEVARFQMDAHNGADDLDLYVYRDGELVGQSATSSADETVTLMSPTPGDYTVYVNAHSAANGSTTTGQFFSWVVSPGDTDTVALSPAAIPSGPGNRFSYEISWDDLAAGRWFGAVRYGDSEHRTLVTVR